MTEEALTAEASRYESIPDVFGGDRVLFSSSPLSGCDRVLVVGGVLGTEVIDEGVGPQESENLEEKKDQGSSWDESSLAKFSKTLGFTTEGVEGEILKLLLRLKTRRDQGKKKGISGMSSGLRSLQETKMSEMSIGVVRSLGVGRFLEWGVSECEGVLELVGMEVGFFSISCQFKNCEDGFSWIFLVVYDPTLKRYRELFWEELGAICGLWSDPWCIGGDFNMIRFPNESRRAGRLSSSMRRFSEVIDDLDLRDLPL
ncbi:hypothetical protein AAG906_020066 [Vitis piasezkii]